MPWKWMLILSPVGIIMGLLFVTGTLPQWLLAILWLLVCVLTGWFFAVRVKQRWWLPIVLLGLFWGVCHGFIEGFFFDDMIANTNYNVGDIGRFGIEGRYWVMIIGPLVGAMLAAIALAGALAVKGIRALRAKQR